MRQGSTKKLIPCQIAPAPCALKNKGACNINGIVRNPTITAQDGRVFPLRGNLYYSDVDTGWSENAHTGGGKGPSVEPLIALLPSEAPAPAPETPEATTETYPVEGPETTNAAEEAAKTMTETVLKPVVWLMRHQPTTAQSAWLAERGLRAVQPEAALAGQLKFASGADAWAQALAANDGAAPAAVVGVIPVAMLPDYLRAAGQCPLWRMEMEAVTRPADVDGKPVPAEYIWTGKVTRIVRVEVVTETVA